MIFFAPNHEKSIFTKVLVGLGALLCLNLSVSLVSADQYQVFESSKNIQLAAKIFLEEMTNAADNQEIEVTVNNLDPRLRLRLCEDKLQTYLPMDNKRTGRITVGISCQSPVAWKVFVSATVYEYADVVIAKTSMTKKDVITIQDIEIKRVNISKLNKQPIINLTQAINTSARRYLRAGSIIFEDSICMVCRGDVVQISAKSQFFNINLQGIALADATIGENTQVRNSQSNRSFNARVIGKNRLEVSLAATK